MNLTRPLATLVPHEPPMLWIDDIAAIDPAGEHIVCRVTLRGAHAFVENGAAETIVAIEWMAQAVAAFVGLEDANKGTAPRPGYLVAIPEARLLRDSVAVGTTVSLTCTRRFGDELLASFTCVARQGDDLLAEAVINVYRPAAGAAS
jgi:predicted hotdog family 3-hydroxylacyl-ACP dehydratase